MYMYTCTFIHAHKYAFSKGNPLLNLHYTMTTSGLLLIIHLVEVKLLPPTTPLDVILANYVIERPARRLLRLDAARLA